MAKIRGLHHRCRRAPYLRGSSKLPREGFLGREFKKETGANGKKHKKDPLGHRTAAERGAGMEPDFNERFNSGRRELQSRGGREKCSSGFR